MRPPAPAHTRRPEYPSGLRADIGRLAGMPAQEPLGDRIPSGWCLRNSAGRGDIATSAAVWTAEPLARDAHALALQMEAWISSCVRSS